MVSLESPEMEEAPVPILISQNKACASLFRKIRVVLFI